jgi:hypothetical protein
MSSCFSPPLRLLIAMRAFYKTIPVDHTIFPFTYPDLHHGLLGVFLQWLLPGNVSYQNSAITFIEGFYPVSEIVGRLKRAEEDKVQWPAEHAAAIGRFWDFYNQESSSPSPPAPEED